jgi:hypothetical protein
MNVGTVYRGEVAAVNEQPAKRGSNTVVVVLVATAVLGLLVVVPLLVGVVIGVRRAMKGTAGTVDPTKVQLSESYSTTNKLLTVHYPSDFAAKKLDDSTVVIVRNFGDASDEVVTFGAVQNPITDDVHEFGRILLDAIAKNVVGKGGTWTRTSERPSTCIGPHAGVEIEATFKLPLSKEYVSKSCFFMSGDRGYEFRYDVPRAKLDTEAPLLERIIDATDLAP